MRTTIKWAHDDDRAEFFGPHFNQQQILSVWGTAEQEFYEWFQEGALGVYVLRMHLPMKEFPRCTYVVFAYEYNRDENVQANNDAYARIKLAWKGRDGVRWEAEDFVKCVRKAG
jgi:hypothetical protein